MLTLVQHVCGRPWAVQGEIAAHFQALASKEGLAGLRHLAEIKQAVHRADRDDDEDNRPRGPEPPRGYLVDGNGAITPFATIQAAIQAAGPSRGRSTSAVAVVPMIGTLTQRGDVINSASTRSTDAVAAEVETMANDPGVDGIVLEADGPGGEVFGVPEGAARIRLASARTPVVASVNSMAASATFWLCSAASEIMVTLSGLIGSVGVYSLHVEISKALEAAGERWTFISAGRYKVEGNPAEPLSPEGLAAIQADVNRYYDSGAGSFVGDLARFRGVAVEAVRRGFGEGRLVGAKAAVAEGMADRIGTLNDAIARAAELGRAKREGRTAADAGDGRRLAAARLAG